ncbi:MAG: hypothetical protein QM756_46615 [Polyangiaceae bacterium]
MSRVPYLALLVVTACAAAARPTAPAPVPAATVVASAAASASSAPEPPLHVASQVIDLWPEGVPDALPDAPEERIEDGRVYNVKNPTLAVFPAPAQGARGVGVIVCPGGGYVRLAINKEGSDVTRFLNSIRRDGLRAQVSGRALSLSRGLARRAARGAAGALPGG